MLGKGKQVMERDRMIGRQTGWSGRKTHGRKCKSMGRSEKGGS